MRRIVSLITGWLLLFCIAAVAQQPGGGKAPGAAAGTIYGKLLDAQSNKPIEYASVALLRPDSSVQTGMLSKPNGDFSFENIPLNKYILRINFIGYETVYRNAALSGKSGSIDIGNVKLKPNVKSLSAVNVVGEKPAFTMAIDKRVFNVEKTFPVLVVLLLMC